MAVSKAKEQQLKILGCTINFVQVGQGRRNLLLLPGWLGTWRSDFEGILDGFDHEEFTMVAWDPPGYGKSTVEGYRRCIPHECKLDAAKAHKLMKQLGLLPFSVLGWSEGGVTALHIAHKAPNTVSKVIIWGAPSYVTKEEVALSERRTQLNVFSPETKSRLITEYGEAELEDMLKRTVQLNRWLNECHAFDT
uniref:AB hydrolase-1 domain-containing protein n=1 Tax=Plectus sambesii TaxID=2011161 RepID=A0A914W5R9_9BILA